MEKNSASAVVGQQQQQHEAAQQKPSKKKSKNKKHNGKSATQASSSSSSSSSTNGSNGQTDVDGEVAHTPHAELKIVVEAIAMANGLSEEVKQKLHIDSMENACKVNGLVEAAAAATATSKIEHEPRTATQNGHHHHHHTANAQQHHDNDNDVDGCVNDHQHPKQQKHQKPQHEQTNGADALPSTATNNNNNNNNNNNSNNNNNHNKKSKSSKSNKSKNKSNVSDIDVDRGLQQPQQQQQQNQEQQRTQSPAHTAVASNGASIGQNPAVSGNTANGFSSSCSNNSTSSSSDGNTVDVTKQTHNTNDVVTAEVAADVTTHAKANQLSAHPAAATATSSNTANKDIDSIAPASTTTAAATSSISSSSSTITNKSATANASNPAQTTNKTDSGNVDEEAEAKEKEKVELETGDTSATSDSVVTTPALDLSNVHIDYKEYESELQMHDIMRLIQAELSEPYSIYTYRYFIYNWPKLCFLAAHGSEYVGAIVCKLDMHMNVRRGYIAMLAVRKEYRKLKIGTTLVQKAIEAMLADNADEVVLETEMRNVPALRLYENLGFVRDKRLFRYYLNGVDALRLKLWFR